jgi:hypothetical protein
MKSKDVILVFLLACLPPAVNGQPFDRTVYEADEQLLTSEKLALLSDLRNLDMQALNLPSVSRGLVKAEIADAAWSLDREWSKMLLTKAYELTMPSEDERNKLRAKAVGLQPTLPPASDRARRIVRNRIVQIAARDQGFADRLIRSGIDQLGSSEGQMTYAMLANNAWQKNDLDSAGRYLLQSVESDPSQIAAGFLLVDIAKTDRARADQLILEYFARLSAFPLSSANNSVVRIYLVVHQLIFPPSDVKPPSALVMKAYVRYVIQSFAGLEQREPGTLTSYRPILLWAWMPLNQYTPELMSDFLVLEQQSRGSKEFASPDVEAGEILSRIEQNRRKGSTESDFPNERVIIESIGRRDFGKARKLIEKLPEGSERSRLADLVNSKEALYFLNSDKFFEARALAEKLRQASLIRETYTALIAKCISIKDETSATDLMILAMKQLKNSDPLLTNLPSGMPSLFIPTRRDFDPILDGMAKLTLAVSPISDEIAMVGLAETVAAANVSELDTAQGGVGFDVSIFKKLAPKNERRVREAAESFKDTFRRLLSLASIDQWKAADLGERFKRLLQTKQRAAALTQ